MDKARVYLEEAMQCFRNDPPGDEFTAGYLAALMTIYEDLYMTQEERAFNRMRAINQAIN